MTKRCFLLLQGPVSPFFPALGSALAARGHAVFRINVCLGDALVWRGTFWREEKWKGMRPEGVTVEDFRGRLSDWPNHIQAFLERHAITDVLLLGEQRPYHRIAIAAARARGASVIATDFGYIRPDWIILERDGHNALSRYPREPEAIRALAEGLPPCDETRRHDDHFPSQARWDVMFHVSNLAPWPFRHFRTFQLYPVLPAYLGTGLRLLRRKATRRRAEELLAGLPEDAPLFVFAMQMENDYSIRAYSPYEDMDTPLRETVRSFAAHAPPTAHLAVKVHPFDPGLKNWPRRLARMARAAGVTGRVHLVDAIDLDPVILRGAGMITVNSTAGIRALQLGKPVIALGEALYRVRGITHEGGLNSFWHSAQPPDAELTDAFLRGIAHHLHVRGVFYAPEGLAAAVAATVERLEQGVPEFGGAPAPVTSTPSTSAGEVPPARG